MSFNKLVVALSLTLVSAQGSPAAAQTYSDGADVTGTALDCRNSNRLVPTVARQSGPGFRTIAQNEAGISDRSRAEITSVLGQPTLQGASGFIVQYFNPATGAVSSTAGSPFVPLCALALTSDLQAIDARVGALESQGGPSTTARLSNVELAVGEIARAAALAGVLDIAMPVNGRSNRLGVTVNEGYREEAIGVSYVRVQGPIDIGVALGYAGGQSSGKASVGFSW